MVGDKFYTVQLMTEYGYLYLRTQNNGKRYYKTLKAAKSVATRKMWSIGPAVCDGVRILVGEEGIYGAPCLAAMRYYNRPWRE